MAKCKNCTRLYKEHDEESEMFGEVWCDKICGSPDVEAERDCIHHHELSNAERIRRMSDEELEKFIRSVQCCSHYGTDCGYPFCHSMNGDLCNGIRDNTDTILLEWLRKEIE